MKLLQPLISVVIPVFNRSWQLKRALKSLKEQYYTNFEVIVCDDGSTEDIASVVKNFDKYLSVSYLRIDNWGGPAKPRNKGLEIAKGKWISFLDSDDWWDSSRLATIANYLDDTFDFYYHPLRIVRESAHLQSKEKRTRVGSSIFDNPFKQMMLFGNPIPTSAVVVKKDLLLAHHGMTEDQNLVSLEDFDCWLRLASAGANICYIPQCLGNYWVGSDAISKISERQIYAQKLLYSRHQHMAKSLFGAKVEARQNYVLGLMYYRIGKPDEALYWLRRAHPLPCLKFFIKRLILIIFSKLKILKLGIGQFILPRN